MAPKRKPSAPPARPTPAPSRSSSSHSDSDSSSDEERLAPAPKPSRPQTPARTAPAESESESQSDSDSEPKPTPDKQTRTVNSPQKPSESEDEEEENVKSAVKNPESQPDKKKPKLAAPDQPPSKKKSSGSKPTWTLKDQLALYRALSEYHAKNERLPSRRDCKSFLSGMRRSISFAVTKDQLFDKIRELRHNFNNRIWTPKDELALLPALSEYRAKNGKLPPRKGYKAFLTGISGSISFRVTEYQLFSKISNTRQLYYKRKEKGPDVTFAHRHDEAVYNLCKAVFEDSNKPSKEKTALKPSNGSGTESHKRKQKGKSKQSGSERMASAGVGSGGVVSGHDKACSHFYLHGLVKDLMCAEQCLGSISTVEGAIKLIGESRVQDLEAKTKTLRIDTIKLCMREEMLRTELFDIISDVMTDN